MSITLTASPTPVTVEVGPAALLPEAEGGIALRLRLLDRAMVITLTRREAQWLRAAVDDELAVSNDGVDLVDRLRSFYELNGRRPFPGANVVAVALRSRLRAHPQDGAALIDRVASDVQGAEPALAEAATAGR